MTFRKELQAYFWTMTHSPVPTRPCWGLSSASQRLRSDGSSVAFPCGLCRRVRSALPAPPLVAVLGIIGYKFSPLLLFGWCGSVEVMLQRGVQDNRHSDVSRRYVDLNTR